MAPLRRTRTTRTAPHRGFSLIELMIVVAIVAILASVAYPAYQDSVLKGRRAEARTALVELMQQQERYMTQRNTYLDFSNAAGVTTPANARDIFKVFAGNSANNVSYWLYATACSAPNNNVRDCIKLVATPARAGSDPKVGDLWITSVGEKGCTTNASICWK